MLIIVAQATHTLSDLKRSVPAMLQAAQRAYDAWEQDDEGLDPELGAGGICQDIAEEMAGVLLGQGIDAATVSQQVGDQHVYVLARLVDGVYEVDIPPSVYESGSGYVWRKIPGVRFDESMLSVYKISGNPADFEEMTGEWM